MWVNGAPHWTPWAQAQAPLPPPLGMPPGGHGPGPPWEHSSSYTSDSIPASVPASQHHFVRQSSTTLRRMILALQRIKKLEKKKRTAHGLPTALERMGLAAMTLASEAMRPPGGLELMGHAAMTLASEAMRLPPPPQPQQAPGGLEHRGRLQHERRGAAAASPQQQAPGHQGKQRVRHNRSARSRSRSASSQGSNRRRHNRSARSRKRRSSAGIRRPRRSSREAKMKPPLQATYQGGGRYSGTSGASKSTTTSASSAWASWGLRTKPNGNSTVPRPPKLE